METSCNFISLISSCFLIAFSSASIIQTSTLLGVHPQEEKYFASEVIKCRDGSKSFTRDRLNDGFCDCVDGTDEPGTSACPEGKFYCINVGSTPQLLFSSRVNDRFCDCCDGSDEYDGAIQCSNTCYKDGKVVAEDGIYNLTTNLVGIGMHETKRRANLEDLIQKLKGLKIVIAVEVVLVSCVMGLMAFRVFRWHFKSRQRRLAEKYIRLHNKSSL